MGVRGAEADDAEAEFIQQVTLQLTLFLQLKA